MLSSPASLLPDLDRDTRQVARAAALLWTFHPRSAACDLLRQLGWKRGDGRAFTQEDVRNALARLRERGLIDEMPHREGYCRLRDEMRGPLYRELLTGDSAADLQQALHAFTGYRREDAPYRWPIHDTAATVALFRLAMFSGMPAKELHQMAGFISHSMHWGEVLSEAVFPAFDAVLFQRVDPQWRWDIAYNAATWLSSSWYAPTLPLVEWALAQMESGQGEPPAPLRLALAEVLMQRGEAARTTAALAKLDNGAADALRACLLAQAGRYAEALPAFEAALKRRQAEVSAKKQVFPATIAWLYPLCLLAGKTPKHLELARKFCLGEAGKRSPSPYEGWGRWVHAIGAGLGETALDKLAFLSLPFSGFSNNQAKRDDLWRLLLAAWLGTDALGIGTGGEPFPPALDETCKLLAQILHDCRFEWLAAQAEAAAAVLRGEDPASPFFVAGRSEAWRDVLAALQALGGEAADAAPAAEASRVLWLLHIDAHGALAKIEPLEQKRGVRGWSKPKPLSLSRLAGNEKLPAWDTKVARAIRPERNYANRFFLDRAAAVMALVGHPAVALAEAPEQFVELVEGQPEIEVTKQDGRFVMRVTPPLRAETAGAEHYYPSAEEQREREALRAITLVRDSPKRVRLVRLSAAQRRAALLLSRHLDVPGSAQDELQKTLRALAGHFQVQADHSRADREIAGDSRLRAELSPAGEALTLRLVVAPLGGEGPRLVPGQGRPRLMAAIGGETVGTRRDLQGERAHLDTVLDAFPFLDEAEEGACEWLLADPEEALSLVERLPGLAAVAAVDWPKGKSVRVVSVDSRQLGVTVKSERDWFRIAGQATLDEGLVLQLQTLLAAAQEKSRFIPMGEGVYAALTRNLKERLADLAALAETDRQGTRLPRLASAWLDEALNGVAAKTDADFRAAVERLRRAQDEAAPLPGTLQAQLRPYQEDGFRWAMRLAAAGFGGCLADDMGLGKTLQALAVLLARAADGPALVLAPTSVCGNWRAEAQRFAPTLNAQIYGEGDREAALAGAGAGDLLIVSYTLFQQAQERFAEKRWHTLVADEAQAIKNAGAKRSQAVFELDADFRLALSGTPVENRLAELWSIMRFANPGLLGSLGRFNERFATPIERNRDREAQHLLRRLIAPFVLRRTKAQVLQELPPRTELLLTVAPDAGEAAHYEALRRLAAAEADQALAEAPAQAKLNILAQLTRLRRAACDPRLTTPEFAATGAKVQAFAELAGELSANGHKTLVFSQFVDFLTLLRAPLDAAGIRYQYLDGATPAAERTRRVAAFQNGEGDLFLISLKAGGFGLNLTAADYVVITDPWWNPAAEDQAMGRAHRIGQQRPVTVYRMVARGTVEERIVELHRDKRALADSVLAEGDAAALPSTDDLVALIKGTGE